MEERLSALIYLKENNAFRKMCQNVSYDSNNFSGILDIDIPLKTNEIYIEFDSIVIFKNIEIVSNFGDIGYKNLNGIKFGNLDLFVTEKPKISIDFENKDIEFLRIKFEIYKFSREYAILISELINIAKRCGDEVEARRRLEEEIRELIEYKQKYLDILPQRDELQNKVNELSTFVEYRQKYLDMLKSKEDIENSLVFLQSQYNSISNSTCWRITKPVRICLDLLKHNKLVELARKVSKSVQDNGVKNTCNKIKNKLVNENKSYDLQNNVLSIDKIEKQEKTEFPKNIKLSILVAVSNNNKEYLCDMINSVLCQTYKNLELCLTTYGKSYSKDNEKIIKEFMKNDKRIKYKKLKNGIGKQESIENALKIAEGEYIVILGEKDMLAQDALYEIMNAICYNDADFIYSDEDKFDESLQNCFDPYYKPDYAPDTLRTHNYISNLIAFEKKLLHKIEKSKVNYKTAYDYDLTLKLTEKADKIYHIPKILYHMRFKKDKNCEYIFPKQYDAKEAKEVISNHLKRLGKNAEVVDSYYPNIYKVNYKIKKEPLVSIIILNKDKVSYLKKCIDSIIQKTTYKNYEILVVENNSVESKTFEYYKKIKSNPKIKILTYDKSKTFNFSAINNYAVEFAKGDMLLFLNNDMEVISPDWIEELLMYAQNEDVGIVGAKLYYQSGAIQHAGVCIGLTGVAAHYFEGVPDDFNGYFGRMHCLQNLCSVTGACIMLRREVFEKVNGFDEALAVAYNDLDLCLKIFKSGYSIIWTPYSKLYHYESITRGYSFTTEEKQKKDKEECIRFLESWNYIVEKGDPYYNINLPKNSRRFKFED